MRKLGRVWLIVGTSLAIMSQAALAADAGEGWRFGIGTGLSSFSLDGEIGFPTVLGGVVVDVDLSNDDTSDLVQSGAGLAGFAASEKWTFLAAFGKVTLEDEDSNLKAEWDKSQAEITAVYNFASLGSNNFGAQFGVRYTKHEWDFSSRVLTITNSPDEDWTDAVIGVIHTLPLTDTWSWRNTANYAFGDSEGTTFLQTALLWQAFEHWRFSIDARYLDTEFGDKDDRNDSDFYYYNVEEPAFGLSFMFTW
jgi:hypothetical protein